MASLADREFAYDFLPFDGKLNALYTTLDKFTSALTQLTERMVAVESHLFFSPATPMPPIIASATTSKKAKSKKGKNLVAPTSTPRTNRPAPTSELVFEGPVYRTGKRPENGLDWTGKDRKISPVFSKIKNQRLQKTG